MFKDVLKNKNMSAYALAKKSGISYTAINELNRGERTVEQCSGKTIKAIADTLGLTMDQLYSLSLKRIKMPKELKPYFWDTNFNKLDLEKNKVYIISRLLNQGGHKGYKFLINAYSYEDFKYVGMHSRMLDPKIASYLSNVYKINKKDMKFYQIGIDWRNPTKKITE